MHDLDETSKVLEGAFGLISGAMLYGLYQASAAAGSRWDYDTPHTMHIVVTKDNAAWIYGSCKEIGSGYDIGLSKSGMAKIKAAREEAHRYLVAEAQDPATPIERKIELVKLTTKTKTH
jgi:hypothetical protein